MVGHVFTVILPSERPRLLPGRPPTETPDAVTIRDQESGGGRGRGRRKSLNPKELFVMPRRGTLGTRRRCCLADSVSLRLDKGLAPGKGWRGTWGLRRLEFTGFGH